MRSALALSYAFDRWIGSDVQPLRDLVRLPIVGGTIQDRLDRQALAPAAVRRIKAPSPLRWARFEQQLAASELGYVGLHRANPCPDAEVLGVHFECTPPEVLQHLHAAAPSSRSRRGYRYKGTLVMGASYIPATVEAQDALVLGFLECWMSRIDAVAGVLVAADTAAYAGGIALGSGGMPGTELDRRATAVYVASHDWGPKAREPEWGTYLTTAHADAIGGVAAIRAAVEPYRVLEAGGVVFVQLSRYEDALAPETEDKRARLEALMAPIVATPLSRKAD